MDACNLCLESSSSIGEHPWNVPLFESENFRALPSLGALIEGWLLLAPKRHFISLGALPDSLLTELRDFKALVASALTACYDTVSAFEHGPSAARRPIGCGVDHAHLHLVPVSFDLSTEVAPLLPTGVAWAPAGISDCQVAYGRGADYLFLEQPIGSGRIATHDAFDSQIFRRAVASRIGMRDQYNWREHDQIEIVIATIRRLRTWQGKAPLPSDVAA